VSWAQDIQATLGRKGATAAALCTAAGVVAFLSGLGGGSASGTYGTLIGSWLFFAGGAVGAVAFGALFRIIPARWARGLITLSRAPVVFAPVALGLLVVILAGAGSAPWVTDSRGWLATPVLVSRELVLTAVLFGTGWVWFGPRPAPAAEARLAPAVTFLIGYTVVVSIWAFDFVLGPDSVFGSTVVGPWVFVSTFLAGTDLLLLLALARGELSPSDQRDASALLLALTVFWTYLFASQALTIWYGNLPDETEFLIRRLQGSWRWAGLAMLALVFAIPFAALLHGVGRVSKRVLAAVLVGQLAGLWIELQILVVPSLTPGDALFPLHPRVLLIALGMLGSFVLCIASPLKHVAAPGAGAALPVRLEGGVSRGSGG
jgi:hypothetical protein